MKSNNLSMSDALKLAANLPAAERERVLKQLRGKVETDAVPRRKKPGTGPVSERKRRHLAAMRERLARKVETSSKVSFITMTVPIRAENPLNNRKGWRAVWGRSKDMRAKVAGFLGRAAPLPSLPVVVTLIREGKRRMDFDGAVASLKAARDAVADCYGVDDADGRYEWKYEQRVGSSYAVGVTIIPAAAAKE